MPRLKNVKTSYEGTYGAELDSASSGDGRTHVLMAADEKTLNWARVHWPQFSEDEIDWTPAAGKMKVTLKASGARLRIMLGNPVGREEPCGVVAFCIRDGGLVLLERPGRRGR